MVGARLAAGTGKGEVSMPPEGKVDRSIVPCTGTCASLPRRVLSIRHFYSGYVDKRHQSLTSEESNGRNRR